MTPLEFVSLSEKDIKTLLENTSKKLGTIDLKEVVGSIVPTTVSINSGLGVVFKKKLRAHTFGPSIIICFYLRQIVYIKIEITTGEFTVDKYLMERKEITKL